MLNYNDIKGVFVFIGQNATTGTVNHITGRLSYYGDYYAFSSKEEANQWLTDTRLGCNQFAVIGTARTLRKYSLGLTVHHYINHLLYIQSNDIDGV